MALTSKDYERIRQEAERKAQENTESLQSGNYQPQAITPNQFKVWTDAWGNVNKSNLTTGETQRYYQRIGAPLKRSSKDSFGEDLNQALSGAVVRQGANYRSALGTLGLGIAGLVHGDNNYQPEVGSTLWKLIEGSEAGTKAANAYMEDSKKGRGAIGSFAMDLTTGAVDLIGDQVMNLVVPGSGFAAMGIRSFGGGAEDSRQQGKSISTQFLKGLKSAAVEVATEKMWQVGGVGAGGEGFAQGLIDQGFARVAKRGGNVFLTKLMTAFGTEAVEEMASDLLNPLADRVIAGIVRGDYDVEEMASIPEILYDGLIGGALGLLGGTSEGIQAQQQLRSMGAEGYGAFLDKQMADKRDASLLKKAVAWGVFKDGVQKTIDKLVPNRADTASPETLQNAATEPLTPDQQSTPEATPLTPDVASPEFNSNAEADVAAEPAEEQDIVERILGGGEPETYSPQYEDAKKVKRFEELANQYEAELETAETQADKDALRSLADDNRQLAKTIRERIDVAEREKSDKLKSQPQEASTAAAQPQEGQDNGETGTRSETAGRQDSQNDGRLEQPGRSSRAEENRERGTRAGDGEVPDSGRKIGAENPSLKRVAKAKAATEKRSKAVYSRAAKNAASVYGMGMSSSSLEQKLKKQGVPEEQIVRAIEDAAMANVIYHGQLEKELIAAGLDKTSAKEIADEVYSGEDASLRDNDVPFTVDEEPKAESKLKPDKEKPKPIKAGKLEITTDKNGKRVATVTKQGDKYNQKITKDVETVRQGTKFVKTEDDVERRGSWLRGTRIYQRGVGDDYIVVNKDGLILGRTTSWGAATQIAKGKGKYWNAVRMSLGGNYVVWGSGDTQGQLTFDTTDVFTTADPELIVTQGSSFGSDELGVELNKHVRTGFGGSTNTNIMFMQVGEESFAHLLKENGGNFTRKQVESIRMNAMRQLLVGIRDRNGNIVKKPGITGSDGRHYVFAGQTSSMRKNGVVILMEENKYNAFRKKMTGGLDPEEIEKFNPAKYLTNQGTVWTPSEADTGVKGKDILVAGEIYKTLHDVTRTFLRTSDLGEDTETLEKGLYSKELRALKSSKTTLTGEALEAEAHKRAKAKAKKLLNKTEIGEAILVTCDLVTKATDGTGFTRAGREMQVRGLGGIKGFLEQIDYVKMYEDVVPFGSEPFVWYNDAGEISGGLRYVDRAKGVEMMNKWGKWQALKDTKVIMFESMVKFSDNYTVRDSNGKVDAEASTKKFYDSVGNSDLRSIPIENLFGYSEGDSGMADGFTAKSMEQLLRSQEGVSAETMKEIIEENVKDPIRAIMKDAKSRARAIGVDFDSKTPPNSSDVRAYIGWFFGPKFFNTNLGKKWAYEAAVKVAEDVRGGKLYLKDGKHSYQWVAPDPFGIVNMMTQFVYQGNEERMLGSKNYTKSGSTAFNQQALLDSSSVYSKRLGKGLTAIGRFPSTEANDVQTRKNARNKAYEELREKYGVGDKALFISLNDTLALNLDNDYDGDTVLAWQGALSKAIDECRKAMGDKKSQRAFTEFTHGSAEPDSTQAADFIYNSVRLALDADNVGRFDNYIEYLQAMPDEWLKDAAKEEGLSVKDFRALLQMNFSAAYKLNFDYAKNAKYDLEFANKVVDFMKQLGNIAKSRGYYIDDEGLNGDNPLETYTSFFAVPGWWEYSSNKRKRDKYMKALQLAKKTKKETVLPGGSNLMSQIYSNKLLGKMTDPDYRNRMQFLERMMKELDKPFTPVSPVDLEALSTVDPYKYKGIKEEFFLKFAKAYSSLVNKANTQEERYALLKEMYDICDFEDPAQFQSLMTYALQEMNYLDPHAGWMGLLNFNQKDGKTPVSEIFKRNARILGSMNKIGELMNSLRQDMYDAIEHSDKARKAVADLEAENASQLTIKQAYEAEFDNYSRELAWLDSLYKRLQFSKDTFRNDVATRENVAALMGEREQFNAFANRLREYESRFDSLVDDVRWSYDVADRADKRISELSGELAKAVEKYRNTVESVSNVLEMLNDEYEAQQSRLNDESVKAWFYGIQTDAPSGLENDRKRAIIEAKMDNFLVRHGVPLSGDLASEEFEQTALDMKDVKIVNKGDGYEYIKAQTPETVEAPPAPKQEPPKRTVIEKAPEPAKAPAPPSAPTSVPANEPVAQTVKKVESAPEQRVAEEPEAEPVDRHTTYPRHYSRIEAANDEFGKTFGESAKNIVPDSFGNVLGDKFGETRHDLFEFGKSYLNAVTADDGGKGIREFAGSIPERVKKSAALQTLLGKDENSIAWKAAKRVAESENAMAFENAVAEFAEILVKESAEFKNTVETISQWKKNIEKRGKFTKFLAADNALSRTLSMFFGYQRDFINIAMGLDNFRKNANGAGYRLAQAIMDGEFAGVNVMGNALDIAIKAKKAWDASEASKKTVELSFIKDKQRETHTVSAALAVDFLHTLETLARSKIDAWNNVIYLVGDERIRMTSEEQYLSVKEALEKAVLKDEAAKAYYDSFSEGYALFKDPSKSAVKNASGRTVEMYEDGSYYPISTNATGKGGPKDYNFGMDDAMYTKSRIKIDGGIINVFDPSVRFNSYVNMATKVVSRAEVGATLERLNRGGIVDSLEDIVTERYGKGHTDVVKQMIKDSNDFRADSDEVSSFLRTLRLNIQTGALFGNFGSMLKQYPSVFNSVGVLDFDDVIYGMSRIVGKNEEKEKASAVGAIRSRYQNFDPDVKDAFDNDTAFNKFFKNIQKKAPWLAVFSDGFQRIDSNAIKTIYIAARHNVLKRGISESDPDFENKVMELFKPAFLLTQPQFDKMMRPYVQTAPNELIRMFGMFKTQPLRNFNTMIRAVEEFKAVKNDKGSTAEDVSKASMTLAQTIAGQATASLMFGVLGVLSKLIYHRRKDLEDEEGKLDAGMMLTRALLDAVEATSGMVVFGDSASKFAIDTLSGGKTKEFYNVNAGTISSIKSAVDDLTKFAEQPGLAKGRQLATDLSTLFGIPLSNAYAIVNSAIMYTRDFTGGNENHYQDIMKALDAEAKAAKKAEEKAAKSGKSDGAALLADTAKANAPESELNSTGETIDSGVSRNLAKPYNALTEAGMSDEESRKLMSFIDMDGNGNLKQAELIAFYRDNPDYEAYAEAMWNSYGWKTTWEAAKKKAGK